MSYYINALTKFLLGNAILSDRCNYRIRMVKASSGIITTIAGTGAISYSGDGGDATSATFNYPNGVAVDPSGKRTNTEQPNVDACTYSLFHSR